MHHFVFFLVTFIKNKQTQDIIIKIFLKWFKDSLCAIETWKKLKYFAEHMDDRISQEHSEQHVFVFVWIRSLSLLKLWLGWFSPQNTYFCAVTDIRSFLYNYGMSCRNCSSAHIIIYGLEVLITLTSFVLA